MHITILALFNSTPGQSSAVCLLIVHARHLNSISSFNLPTSFMHPTPENLTEGGIADYIVSLQTLQGNFPSIATFPAFSLLNTLFVFLTFTLNPFGSNTLFQTSSLPFSPSDVSLANDSHH